ncbi:uncharacterized protein A4U43_C05F8370 [Asparagus officinalis]|uniref:Uncharacterized protein n=1 Tax=Asparagus officinalis TaxID=4686 RepID=A0A5P1EQ72_ASPOF|nr:uncharacterized protein A4U43_C05F8370 [Asparagus officinalis]
MLFQGPNGSPSSTCQGKKVASGSRWPSTIAAPSQWEMMSVPLPDMSVSKCNHLGHSGTQDPLMLDVFRGKVPLFYEESSQEHVKAISRDKASVGANLMDSDKEKRVD